MLRYVDIPLREYLDIPYSLDGYNVRPGLEAALTASILTNGIQRYFGALAVVRNGTLAAGRIRRVVVGELVKANLLDLDQLVCVAYVEEATDKQ